MIFIFAFRDTLPSGGMHDPFLIAPTFLEETEDLLRHMILPSLTFGLTTYATFMLILRTSLIEALSEDYIVTAQAKGLSVRTVLLRHGLRNALLPVATVLGLAIGTAASSAIIVEAAFSWPGLGDAMAKAVSQHDYPMLSVTFVVITASVVLVNLAVDLIYGWLDPRVRL